MAGGNIFYQDLEIGDEIGPLEVEIKRQQIVRFVKQAGMNYKRFTDDGYARNEGLGGAIVPGIFSMSLLSRMLTEHFGPGTLKKLGVNYRSLVFHGDVINCRGMVTNKRVEGDEHFLECDVFMENQRGEKPIKGNATIRLPSRT